jgi:hypothetical protein
VAVGEDPTQHPFARPLHGGDRGDAQALVDGSPARVVDAGDDLLDAVGLASDAGDEDVGVVAVRDGRQRVGAVDARLGQPVAVEADPDDGGTGEALAEAAEGPLLAIDDRSGVPRGLDGPGQTRTDPSAPDHDHVHGGRP